MSIGEQRSIVDRDTQSTTSTNSRHTHNHLISTHTYNVYVCSASILDTKRKSKKARTAMTKTKRVSKIETEINREK